MQRRPNRRQYLAAASSVLLAGCRSESGGKAPDDRSTTEAASTEATSTEATSTRSEPATPDETGNASASLPTYPMARDASTLGERLLGRANLWRYLTVPDGGQQTALIARDSFDAIVSWYDEQLSDWTVAASYDVRTDYPDVEARHKYHYWHVTNGATKGTIYVGMMRQRRGSSMPFVLHVEGSASAVGEVSVNPPVYDVFERDPPRFVTEHVIDPAKVAEVSYFRAVTGHDYTGTFESCRTKKHYFNGIDGVTNPMQYAPADGFVSYLDADDVADDSNDYRVVLGVDGHPAFKVEIFHVNIRDEIEEGVDVSAGQPIGPFRAEGTIGDLAIIVDTPRGRTYVSYFDVMTDEVFADYQQYGVQSRDDLIISKQKRDQNPVPCEDDGHGTGDYKVDTRQYDNFYDLQS